jgi:hypothetical protein
MAVIQRRKSFADLKMFVHRRSAIENGFDGVESSLPTTFRTLPDFRARTHIDERPSRQGLADEFCKQVMSTETLCFGPSPVLGVAYKATQFV